MWLPFWAWIASLILQWPLLISLAIFGLAVACRVMYWMAHRQGYSRFVADPDPHYPSTGKQLAPNQRLNVRATGMFALAHDEQRVFLRPAEFWEVPLGERVVMVKAPNEQFLYQFIDEAALQRVEAGWLIFGKEPLPSLAVTFCVTWGPSFNEAVSLYYVGNGTDNPPCQERTVVFTFDVENELALVRENLLELLEA